MDPNTPTSTPFPYYDSAQEKGFFENLGVHFIDFIQTLVVIGAVFVLIYLFVAQPHKVSGRSMDPTFHDGDYILTDKITYRVSEPQYGDIVVFKNPRNEKQDFIKRVIATPGDTIRLDNNVFYLNSKPLSEDYLSDKINTRGNNFLQEGSTVEIGEGQYFVVGDNREHSSDSREWGTVTKKEIIGKVFFRYWPLESFGLVKHLPSN